MMMIDIHDIVIIHDALPVFLFSPIWRGWVVVWGRGRLIVLFSFFYAIVVCIHIVPFIQYHDYLLKS